MLRGGHDVPRRGIDELHHHLEPGDGPRGRGRRYGDLVLVGRIHRNHDVLLGSGEICLVVHGHRDLAGVGEETVEGALAVDERHVVDVGIARQRVAVVAGDESQIPGIRRVGEIPVLIHGAHRQREEFAAAMAQGSALARGAEAVDSGFDDFAGGDDLELLVSVGSQREDRAAAGQTGAVGDGDVDVLGSGVALLEADLSVVETLRGDPQRAASRLPETIEDLDVGDDPRARGSWSRCPADARSCRRWGGPTRGGGSDSTLTTYSSPLGCIWMMFE